jgi:hypothetical protein
MRSSAFKQSTKQPARYATLPGFDFAAQAPPVAAERFGTGEVWGAQVNHALVGFVLLQSHVDTI